MNEIKTLNQLAVEHFGKQFKHLDVMSKQIVVAIQANNIRIAQLELIELKFLDKLIDKI